ncbi:PE-PPE domain-containing protein [Rhodococcus erythropolis]|uniref:PE-PPE domain-containing protein n=1 Tax=Rhodococcus erythropolis TaxID=1833 RepID=A0A8I0ZWB1_RHOER|nr:PE-PPE domain-containing protein [Rhodococcus erythropolis]
MSIRSRLTSLFFVVSALSMIVSPFAFATTTTRCAETITFAVDGTKGAGTATSIDPASPLNKIADRYRDQTHRVEHVEYPGGMIKGIGGWSESYDQSVAIGISRLEARIAEEESNCGGSSNFVLLGYSQGARIVGDVASNIDSGRFVTESRDLASRVVVILYADPRQPETGIEVALAGSFYKRDHLHGRTATILCSSSYLGLCPDRRGVRCTETAGRRYVHGLYDHAHQLLNRIGPLRCRSRRRRGGH